MSLYNHDIKMPVMDKLSALVSAAKLDRLIAEMETARSLKLQAEQETEEMAKQTLEKRRLQDGKDSAPDAAEEAEERFIDSLISAKSMQEIYEAWHKTELNGKDRNLDVYLTMKRDLECSNGPLQNLDAVKQAILKMLDRNHQA